MEEVQLGILRHDPSLKHDATRACNGQSIAIPRGLGGVGGQGAVGTVGIKEVGEVVQPDHASFCSTTR